MSNINKTSVNAIHFFKYEGQLNVDAGLENAAAAIDGHDQVLYIYTMLSNFSVFIAQS